MHLFENILILLVAATLLSMFARRLAIPYPALLALGGVGIALFPMQGLPQVDLSPELVLTLFVAPILLDAAHDTSLRDLRYNWRPISSLVLIAVGLTTLAVACITRALIPDMPWPAAIALGALLAPPDAVAAMAVLNQIKPPHRIRTVLEGESLFNDASSLLIYKLAVSTVMAGGFHVRDAIPPFFLVIFGSVIAGWGLARIARYQINLIKDVPTAVIIQFSLTFGIWILAEHLGLSGVITVVVFGFTISRFSTLSMPAHLRVSSFSIWSSVTFILNVLAFTLIGLQLRPIFEGLDYARSLHMIFLALILLVTVIAIRFIWVMFHTFLHRIIRPGTKDEFSSFATKYGLVVSWSGMRGIVTLAAAMALPQGFPHRDVMLIMAFIVVLGTLLIQGLTLGPLLKALRLPKDTTVDLEIRHARTISLKAAMQELEGDTTSAGKRLMQEYRDVLERTSNAQNPYEIDDNRLRRRAAAAGRRAVFDLLDKGVIGDEAYRQVEEELDWFELSAGGNHQA